MAESETRDMQSDDGTTIGWPSAPNVRELPLALMLSVIFAAAIIFLRPVVSSGSEALVACGVAGVVLLVIGIGSRGWLGMIAATVLVTLGWIVLDDVVVGFFSKPIRELSPYNVDSPLAALWLVIRRIAELSPTVALAAGLALSQPKSREHFRQWFRIGSWKAPIRWPLPWWGVPPMPIWVLLLIGVPSAVPMFLPAIDWAATQTRWSQLPLSMCFMIPLLAVINALLEESIFRLGLMSLCSRTFSATTATIPSAVIFAAIHFHGGLPSGLFSLLLLSLGGVWLGYFLIAERGFSVAVFFHAMMDVIVLAFVVK